MTPRRLAVEAVMRTMRDLQPLDDALDGLLEQASHLEARDRALAYQIASGAVRHLSELDTLLTAVMPRPLLASEAFLWAVLRTALYQLRHMRVPAHAAVHEAVEMIKGSSNKGKAGFVNAVLRAMGQRDPDAIFATITDPLARLAVEQSHPEWLVRRWAARLEEAALAARLAAGNTIPPLTLRVNRLRIQRDDYLALLQKAGIGAQTSSFVQDGLVLDGHHAVRGLPGFGDGLFAVQDLAAQVVSELLAPQPGERIFDACAAPGGKTAHLAALSNNEAEIVAMELQPQRMRRLKGNLNRLGLASIQCVVGDAGEFSGEELYDRALVDAPCSGTGVIRRHPEIKWRRTLDDLGQLARNQARILAATARRVRAGGCLVYAVCSLEPEEGVQQINRFLNSHPQWQRISLADQSHLAPALTPVGDFYAEPSRDGLDGFFIAKLGKNNVN